MELDSLYQEIILDHYRKPRGRGLREPFEAQVHHVNPTCGDEIDLRVHVVEETVVDVSYENVGCSISQAAASVLHEVLVGRTVDEALDRVDAFTAMVSGRGQVEPDEAVLEDGVAFAGVARYPARVKCALLSWMAFRDATARAAAFAGASATGGSGGAGRSSGEVERDE
jgi:nitrogen fixation NifU-like protein